MKDKTAPSFTDYGLLILIAAIFGGSFVLISQALVSIPVISVVAGRLVLAAVILLIVMRIAGQSLPGSSGVWKLVVASAIFGNALPFFLITWGQESVDAGLAAILIAVMPLMTVFLAHLFTPDEKLNRYKLIGFLLGLVGIVVLIGLDKLVSLGDQAIRQFALLAAALCYATNALIVKSMSHLPRYSAIAAVLLVSAALVVPFALIVDRPWQLQVSLGSLIAVIALGIVATAIGNLLRFEIADRQGATFLAQNNYLMPIFGVFWAWAILAQTPPSNALLALGFILSGVAIARIRTNLPNLSKAGRRKADAP